MSDKAISEFVAATREDRELQTLITFILGGFPDDKKNLPNEVKPYFNFRHQLSHESGIVFKGEKVVVPQKLINKMIEETHTGHWGITNTMRRARQLLFWIGQAKDVQAYVEKCSVCQKTQRCNEKECILPKIIPSLPFQIVSTDLFIFNGKEYLLIADNYSGYMDFKKLEVTTSDEIIKTLKSWFSVHGIPQILESDNGPQYNSKQFRDFATIWKFEHRTSSPKFPRSNGLAERNVQTAKNMLKKCCIDKTEVELALLNFRNMPRNESIGSPNERLMSRVTRPTIPSSFDQLKPRVITNVAEELERLRLAQKHYADKTSKPAAPLKAGDQVRIQIGPRDWKSGNIIKSAGKPRSFIVETDGRTYRRNSHHLKKTSANIQSDVTIIPNLPSANIESPAVPNDKQRSFNKDNVTLRSTGGPIRNVPEQHGYRTRSGRISKQPIRLNL